MAPGERPRIPPEIKLYHIVHIDRLDSIMQEGHLFCDAAMQTMEHSGTTIGMQSIKDRRLRKSLTTYPNLHVGDCVPFYFCPRSVMLYMFHKGNHPDISYLGGQEPIIHLVFDLQRLVHWAEENRLRWVFTTSNAGSNYFNDYNDLNQLDQINWSAVNTTDWKNCREAKQAEFLIEKHVPFQLIEEICVYSMNQLHKVNFIIFNSTSKPAIAVKPSWYY